MTDLIVNEARKRHSLFIKKRRKEMDYTQADLAKNCEVSLLTIQKIETGRWNYSIDILNKIGKILKFKIDLSCIKDKY
jgi:DNA-binding XRE family transcriptional regulator